MIDRYSISIFVLELLVMGGGIVIHCDKMSSDGYPMMGEQEPVECERELRQ